MTMATVNSEQSAVRGAGVVDLEEELQQLAVGGGGRVVGDLDGLGV
jgi:hypothetical protein